jgi:hypothetical protein
VADINDRLERLNKREQLARRAYQRPLRDAPAEGLGGDFLEVLEAVARTVRRHPGLSVMVAAIDGRPGRVVVRVTERDGVVETGLVAAPTAPAGEAAEPGRHAQPAGSAAAAAWPAGGEPLSRRGAGRRLRAVDEGSQERAEDAGDTTGTGHLGRAETEPQPDTGADGLVALPANTSQVVARLAQLLRDDPSLASGWSRDR